MMPLSLLKDRTKNRLEALKKDEGGSSMIYTLMMIMMIFMASGSAAMVGVSLASHNGATQQLQADLTSTSNDYKNWLAQNPNATEDEKKAHISGFVLSLKDSKRMGAAYDSGNPDNLCMWNSSSNNDIPSRGMTISNIGQKTDCSNLQTIMSSDSNAVRNTNPAPVVNAAPAAPAPEFPWSILLGVAASGAVVGGGGFITYKSVGKVKEAKKRSDAEKKLRLKSRNDWQALLERHDVIRREWSAYELDAMKMLDFPMLSDMREPLTVKLHTALRQANNVRPVSVDSMIGETAKGSDYDKAVFALETAFHVAEIEAKRIQWLKFSAAEQKRLTTAKNLLSMVMDGGASEFERQAAYKRLQKEISGLITLPKMTMNVLEDKMRVMITA